MVKQAVRRCLFLSGLAFATACGPDGSDHTASVTIDVRCGSSADCPTGFVCTSEVEHGPPTTLCESSDPALTCPAGYETKVMYGQTFCKPPRSITAHSPKPDLPSDGGHRLHAGR